MTTAAREALIRAGINTMAKLAFSSRYQPGAPDDSPMIQVLIDACDPTVPNNSDRSCMRRLFFESTTMMLSEMRNKVERVDEAAPRRVPQPERLARYTNQATRLVGMNLVGELDCAHTLLDDTAQQREDGVLKYLAPSQCPKRDQELAGLKKTAGPLPKDIPATADTSTELRIRSALIRRCLAYDQAGLVSYEIGLAWVDYLYAQLMRLPPDANYQAISMAQVLQADRQLFLVLSSLSRSGIAPTSTGVRPLDALFAVAKADPIVSTLLQPLPSGFGRGPTKVQKSEIKVSKKGGGGGKGSGSSASAKLKTKGKGGRNNMPEELKGMHFRTPSGEPICFGYNLSTGCHRPNDCKNKHCCCKPGCYSDHPVFQHPP